MADQSLRKRKQRRQSTDGETLINNKPLSSHIATDDTHKVIRDTSEPDAHLNDTSHEHIPPIISSHIVDRWMKEFDGLEPDSFYLTRIVLLRAIAFIFIVAFLVAYNQNKQLIGDHGLLPLRIHLADIQQKTSEDSWLSCVLSAPTILWLACPWTQVDPWLDGISLVGLLLASFVLYTGAANFFIMIALWVLYFSLVSVGQIWYSFGWESQLLETTLLLCWAVSFSSVSSKSCSVIEQDCETFTSETRTSETPTSETPTGEYSAAISAEECNRTSDKVSSITGEERIKPLVKESSITSDEDNTTSESSDNLQKPESSNSRKSSKVLNEPGTDNSKSDGPFNLPLIEPSYVTIYGLRWLLFRIMLGAGLIKIRGDSCWKDLTCMDYHYETQPVPNPLSWLLHHSPQIIHSLEVSGNHVVELLVPWLMVTGNRTACIICGLVQIVFQVILILSGNLSYLNWLTIVPALALFDDRFYARFFSSGVGREVAKRQVLTQRDHPSVQPGLTRDSVNLLLTALLLYLSLPCVVNLLSSRQHMNLSYDPLRIVNSYGAFGSVTKVRREVILQGLHTNGSWLEYELPCKPGNLLQRPCILSPYHYRLDWLMWFAAMQPAQSSPWLFHLIYQLLGNNPSADSLLLHNPFRGQQPPASIRAQLYRYRYTAPLSGSGGTWYSRTVDQPNFIPLLSNATMRLMAREMGWSNS